MCLCVCFRWFVLFANFSLNYYKCSPDKADDGCKICRGAFLVVRIIYTTTTKIGTPLLSQIQLCILKGVFDNDQIEKSKLTSSKAEKSNLVILGFLGS